jgi:glucosyl-3-phosphoglycerate synthase
MNHAKSGLQMPTASTASQWTLERCKAEKRGSSIAVVIPARNEQGTVGDVVGSIHDELGDFVDELVVMDSLSTDRTASVAANAGARVYSVADVRPDLGIQGGKGEALWKSLFVTTADVIAFIDADLTEWGTHFITGVVGPLLHDSSVLLCRGFYDRILDVGDGGTSLEGGRVTELVARPWLSIFRPELAYMVQPLAGEWAIRRWTMRELSVPVGYGVEMSTLLDVHDKYGIQAIAQVDLGRRAHCHQNVHDLGAMALEILAVAERRRDHRRSGEMQEMTVTLESPFQLHHLGQNRTWITHLVDASERPPHDAFEPSQHAKTDNGRRSEGR